MKAPLRSYIGLILACAFIVVPGRHAEAQGVPPQVVSHDNEKSWKIDIAGAGTVTFDPGPAPCSSALALVPNPPLGSGSLHFMLTAILPNDHVSIRSTRFNGTRLDDLVALDYWTCSVANNGQQWPYIILNIDLDGDNVTDDLLFFEPAYQTPLTGFPDVLACPDQGLPIMGQWQHWDARNGCWWSLNGLALATPGTGVKPLRVYLAAFPNATIVNADGNHGGLRIVHGFGDVQGSPPTFNGQYNSYIDRMEIAVRKLVYDFEPPSQ